MMKRYFFRIGCLIALFIATGALSFGKQNENMKQDTFEKNTIILSAPRHGDRYYKKFRADFLKFYKELISKAHPKDHFLIISDAKTAKELQEIGIKKAHILIEKLPDIWCRDICTVITAEGVFNFLYEPSYHPKSDARYFEKGFDRLLNQYGSKSKKIPLNLDGGNYCHNGKDKAIVCDRVLSENKGLTREKLIDILEPITGSRNIALLPTEEGDTLGHVDGMVSWLDANTLAINAFTGEFGKKVRAELRKSFPKVKLIEVPYEPTEEMHKGIADASGIYTNILHTQNAVYMLNYGSPSDKVAQKALSQNCPRPIIPISAHSITKLGGGLRCLSWQNRSPHTSTPL